MPTNNINVRLDTSTGVNRLDVVDNGKQNEVAKNANPTTISWNLTGPLAQGSFVPMTEPKPGFSWVQDPGPVFGPPEIRSNGKSLEIVDNHVNDDSDGEWIYMLRVNYGGEVVTTVSSTGVGPGGTIDNPVIINKGG